jgi:hypothetical protein
MAIRAYYDVGRINLAAGGTVVTGIGTQWLGEVRPGDILWSAGITGRIASVDSNTSLTLATGWEGPARSNSVYEVRVTPGAAELVVTTRSLLASLSSGILTAFAGLTSAANKLPFFTGAGTMATTDLTAKGREIIGAADSAAARGAIGAISSDIGGDVPVLSFSKDDTTRDADLLVWNKGELRIRVFNPASPGSLRSLTLGYDGAVLQWDGSNVLTSASSASDIPDLPASKAFRRGNILGTVGQSGGVPTGAIIERGSNANGDYVRWADGTQICTYRTTVNRTLDTPSGALFLSSNTVGDTPFPAAFSEDPVQSVSCESEGVLLFSSDRTSLSNFLNTYLFTQVSRAPGTYTLDFSAIGRWF